MMIIRRRSAIKYAIGIVVAIVVYSEWFVYLMQPLFWHKFECQSDEHSCTKILFIADPQIQGDNAVSPPLSYLYNWDSDRYLRQTFAAVESHFKPDVLVYLGDLMDEGSIASMQQFHAYVKRLLLIFDIPRLVVQIWIPGDNDIGGEFESIKSEKVAEFAKVFDQPDVIAHGNISFYKVNKITHTFPVIPEAMQNDQNIKIVISHYPVMMGSKFSQQVNDLIHPDIFFCAHEHTSKYMKIERDLSHRTVQTIGTGDSLWLRLDEQVYYEVYVPTCSYRMGTDKIGFGAAVIEDNESVHYTVFWSPKRFPIIYTYLVILCLLIACLILLFTLKVCFKLSTPHYGANKTLLKSRV